MKLVSNVVLIGVLLVSACVPIQPETTPAPESQPAVGQAVSTPSDLLSVDPATTQENPTETPVAIEEAPTSAPTATEALPTPTPVEPTATSVPPTAVPTKIASAEPVASNCLTCHSDQQMLIDVASPVEEPEDSLSSGVG